MERTNQSGKKKDIIPKKLRFEVFKRDSFTCIYCGRRPPEAVLHADHRIPEAGGGETTILNLVTSCLDCNLGKGATRLDDHAFVTKHHDNAAEMQERREQLQMIADWYHELSQHHDDLQEAINDFFNRRVPCRGIAPSPLQKITRFAEKHQAVDCVFDAIADLAAENVSFEEPGKASKDCAEYIVSRLEHVARNKLALKGLPLVQKEEGQARYLFGILRNKSRVGELPHSVRFYEIVNGILASGHTIAELTHAAKESRGFKHWRQQFDDDDFSMPATRSATPVPRTTQTVIPRSATRTASPPVQPAVPEFPGAPTAFDEGLLESGDSFSVSADEATAHLLNACTAFSEFLAEIADHDFAEEWGNRAGPWIDQVYAQVRTEINDRWPRLVSLDAAARQAEIETSVESTFELFFDGPFDAKVTPAITFLLRRAKQSKDWRFVCGAYNLRALNKWLCTRIKMARYHRFEARISNVPMESEEEVETLQDSMDMLYDARIPYQQSVLDMIETPGHCEELQNYALHLFGQTVVQLGLQMCNGPLDPRLPGLILQTIRSATPAMVSLLQPHQEDDGNIRGGKEWLAKQSPYWVYVELAMTTGIVFPENCDLQAMLVELRDSLQVADEDFLKLLDAGGSPEMRHYARHLLAEAAGPFPTDIPF